MQRLMRRVGIALLVAVGGGLIGTVYAGNDLPRAGKQNAAVPDLVRNADYVGSQACFRCHSKDHAAWKASWHANMHRDVRPYIVVADFNNRQITYTDVEVDTPDKKRAKISPTIRVNRDGDQFTVTLIDKDDAANNQIWPIAYVLGGNWNQHFEARVGNVYYPTPMRWIVEDGQWTSRPFNDLWWIADGTPDGRPRKAEEIAKTKTGDATCDGCHTTGFTATKDKDSGRWMGQKVELGVGCESCHGPGSAHLATRRAADIVNPIRLGADQQDQLCGQCHSRVTNKQEKELSFPTGFRPGDVDLAQRVDFWNFNANPRNFWSNGHASKNRQQLHDGEFGKHRAAGVTCITCHDTHSPRTGYAQVRLEKNALCAQCHQASAAMVEGSVMSKNGVGCVDCHMAKLANRSDPTAKNKDHWDASAHTMAVIQPADAERLKMKSSCDACHSGADRAARGDAFSRQQSEVRSKIAEVNRIIGDQEKSSRNVEKARKLVASVMHDGGASAHNPVRAMETLGEAAKAASP